MRASVIKLAAKDKTITPWMASSPRNKGMKKIIDKVMAGIMTKSHFSIHRLLWAKIIIPKTTAQATKVTAGDLIKLKKAMEIKAPIKPLKAEPANNSNVENFGTALLRVVDGFGSGGGAGCEITGGW